MKQFIVYRYGISIAFVLFIYQISLNTQCENLGYAATNRKFDSQLVRLEILSNDLNWPFKTIDDNIIVHRVPDSLAQRARSRCLDAIEP